MEFEFEIPGPSMGKQRPRFVRRGRFVSTYTPKKTLDYQKTVVDSFNEVAYGRKLEGAVKAEVCAIYEPPKSVSKKKRQEMLDGKIPFTKKPDVDNILKSVFDGLNDIAYQDDCAIDDAHITKCYGEVAKCQVRLSDKKHIVKPLFKMKKEKDI